MPIFTVGERVFIGPWVKVIYDFHTDELLGKVVIACPYDAADESNFYQLEDVGKLPVRIPLEQVELVLQKVRQHHRVVKVWSSDLDYDKATSAKPQTWDKDGFLYDLDYYYYDEDGKKTHRPSRAIAVLCWTTRVNADEADPKREHVWADLIFRSSKPQSQMEVVQLKISRYRHPHPRKEWQSWGWVWYPDLVKEVGISPLEVWRRYYYLSKKTEECVEGMLPVVWEFDPDQLTCQPLDAPIEDWEAGSMWDYMWVPAGWAQMVLEQAQKEDMAE